MWSVKMVCDRVQWTKWRRICSLINPPNQSNFDSNFAVVWHVRNMKDRKLFEDFGCLVADQCWKRFVIVKFSASLSKWPLIYWLKTSFIIAYWFIHTHRRYIEPDCWLLTFANKFIAFCLFRSVLILIFLNILHSMKPFKASFSFAHWKLNIWKLHQRKIGQPMFSVMTGNCGFSSLQFSIQFMNAWKVLPKGAGMTSGCISLVTERNLNWKVFFSSLFHLPNFIFGKMISWQFVKLIMTLKCSFVACFVLKFDISIVFHFCFSLNETNWSQYLRGIFQPTNTKQ